MQDRDISTEWACGYQAIAKRIASDRTVGNIPGDPSKGMLDRIERNSQILERNVLALALDSFWDQRSR
jgi:hypothetical protein